MSYFACVKFDVIKSKVSVFRSSGTKSEATHTQFRRCWHKYNDHVMSVSRVVSTLDITRFPSSFDPRLFLVNPFVGPALPPVTIYLYPLIDSATRLVIGFSLSLKHIRGTSFLFSLLPQRFTPFLHIFASFPFAVTTSHTHNLFHATFAFLMQLFSRHMFSSRRPESIPSRLVKSSVACAGRPTLHNSIESSSPPGGPC